MQFVFDTQRPGDDQRVFDRALSEQWLLSEVFSGLDTSATATEDERLKWAPVLASLAFGEATAFAGFGRRIADAEDLSTKSWLTVHLLDEAKHTEGFSRLLHYLYPSRRGRLESLLDSRDVLVFYGHTHRCDDLTEWLICTQIAEIFGMHCYRELFRRLADEPTVHAFFAKILQDESRHIHYIGSLIASRRAAMSAPVWRQRYAPFVERMARRCRNMFEARQRGVNFKSFRETGIDVSGFCDQATAEIERRLA